MPREAHAFVEFFLQAVPDERASREQGRPIFKEEEMVKIQLVGDRDNNLVARAHEKFQMEKGSGRHITYAERFPDHYKAFKEKREEASIGTPLDHVPFLTAAQRAELGHYGIKTADHLAATPDSALKPGWRAWRDQTRVWLGEADKAAEVGKVQAENNELRDRLARLEEMLAQQQEAPPEEPSDKFHEMDDEELRAWLTERGVHPRRNASAETMRATAREIGE
jgi:hypothetical protein